MQIAFATAKSSLGLKDAGESMSKPEEKWLDIEIEEEEWTEDEEWEEAEEEAEE